MKYLIVFGAALIYLAIFSAISVGFALLIKHTGLPGQAPSPMDIGIGFLFISYLFEKFEKDND